jgi:hypothetical protein
VVPTVAAPVTPRDARVEAPAAKVELRVVAPVTPRVVPTVALVVTANEARVDRPVTPNVVPTVAAPVTPSEAKVEAPVTLKVDPRVVAPVALNVPVILVSPTTSNGTVGDVLKIPTRLVGVLVLTTVMGREPLVP